MLADVFICLENCLGELGQNLLPLLPVRREGSHFHLLHTVNITFGGIGIKICIFAPGRALFMIF